MTPSPAHELAAHINKQMGNGTVKMGSDPYFQVTYLPTGIDPIDDLLQGGIPFGRFIEIFGDYSTLKTYIGLSAIRECQKLGKLAGLIDTEHAFDPKWAAEIGVDVDNLVLKHPETGEEAIDVAELMIRGGVDFIVFDSVAATLPKAEQEHMLSGGKNAQPARQADLMSRAMRKLTAPNKKTGILWINQTRVNVGQMFGSNESVPGGKALGFYSSYRVAVRRAGKITEDSTATSIDDGKPKSKKVKMTTGQIIRATLEKSKLNAPHREVLFNFNFKTGGIDTWWYLMTLALEEGLVGYDRGYYWLTTEIETRRPSAKKYRGRAEFEKVVTEDYLRKILGRHPGGAPLGKRKVRRQKSASSRGSGHVGTHARGQGESKRTVRIKKRSTK